MLTKRTPRALFNIEALLDPLQSTAKNSISRARFFGKDDGEKGTVADDVRWLKRCVIHFFSVKKDVDVMPLDTRPQLLQQPWQRRPRKKYRMENFNFQTGPSPMHEVATRN
jgi:hypothetical protein